MVWHGNMVCDEGDYPENQYNRFVMKRNISQFTIQDSGRTNDSSISFKKTEMCFILSFHIVVVGDRGRSNYRPPDRLSNPHCSR
jgi:hypothetical protein